MHFSAVYSSPKIWYLYRFLIKICYKRDFSVDLSHVFNTLVVAYAEQTNTNLKRTNKLYRNLCIVEISFADNV